MYTSSPIHSKRHKHVQVWLHARSRRCNRTPRLHNPDQQHKAYLGVLLPDRPLRKGNGPGYQRVSILSPFSTRYNLLTYLLRNNSSPNSFAAFQASALALATNSSSSSTGSSSGSAASSSASGTSSSSTSTTSNSPAQVTTSGASRSVVGVTGLALFFVAGLALVL